MPSGREYELPRHRTCRGEVSGGVQASKEFIKRSITLYHLMEKNNRPWSWLEFCLLEQFPEEELRLRPWTKTRNSELRFINPDTIVRWAEDPGKALRVRCSERTTLGCTFFGSNWNRGRCMHMGGVAALRAWERWRTTGVEAPTIARHLKPGRRPGRRA